MTVKDFDNYSEILMQLCDAFGKEYTVSRGKAYWLALNDLSLEHFRRAAVKCLRESKFMPVPAELREAVDIISAPERAILAFGVLSRALALGARVSVNFDDPLINAVVKNTGGWIALTRRNEQALDMYRKAFIETYKCYMKNGISEVDTGHCVGLLEAQNKFLIE